MPADRTDIEEALHNALCDFVGGRDGPQVPGVSTQRRLRSRIKSFLEELPGELTVSEVRQAMEQRNV